MQEAKVSRQASEGAATVVCELAEVEGPQEWFPVEAKSIYDLDPKGNYMLGDYLLWGPLPPAIWWWQATLRGEVLTGEATERLFATGLQVYRSLRTCNR